MYMYNHVSMNPYIYFITQYSVSYFSLSHRMYNNYISLFTLANVVKWVIKSIEVWNVKHTVGVTHVKYV